jgi:hypothetical protein
MKKLKVQSSKLKIEWLHFSRHPDPPAGGLEFGIWDLFRSIRSIRIIRN